MSRRAIGSVIVVTILVGLVWAQSYNGRSDVVASARRGCERGSRDRAAQVNFDRSQQHANAVTATTPGVPSSLRIERGHVAVQQDSDLQVMDSHIDSGLWRLLRNKRDRLIVHRGDFRCARAYPSASPFQFVN